MSSATSVPGVYHLPSSRVIMRAGDTKMSSNPSSSRNCGASSEPTHTMVLPLPDMNTAPNLPRDVASRRLFSCLRRGNASKAGGSRSFTHTSLLAPSSASLLSSASGSSPAGSSPAARPSPLKMLPVGSPSGGLTRSSGVERDSGEGTSRMTSPLPSQYAEPVEKKKGTSEPTSTLHSSSWASVAGRPHISLAAQRAVAALPEPPPRPAPVGTRFSRCTQKYCWHPVRSRNKSSALITRLSLPSGRSALLVDSESASLDGEREIFMMSPRSMAWNMEARSWKPSSRRRVTRRNRLTLEGENSFKELGRSCCAARYSASARSMTSPGLYTISRCSSSAATLTARTRRLVCARQARLSLTE
mmetsp:Transcript_3773/g.13484  ORF Transcript_3773/g.13484 Transcript_3773/m.13484 type:complete len:359 (-) Transcript_3773:12-1088(-)